jgi:hypothetical protein
MMNRTDPKYVEALVAKKPHKDDPKEQRIANLIREQVLQEPWARDAFAKIGDIQTSYMHEMLADLPRPDFVHERTQQALTEISGLLNSTIVEGQENLDKLPKGQSVLVATNHYGAYKLLGMDPQQELGINIEGYDFIYPYLMYFAALKPVAESLADNLYYVSDDFPLDFGTIHREAGFINVPPKQIGGVLTENRTKMLEEQTGSVIESHPHAAIVNFPEGGTSGKYSGLGPYALDHFNTGGYFVAAHLGIPIIPVAQYFNPQKGFELRVFEPLNLDPNCMRDDLLKIGEANKQEMQEWLNARQAATIIPAK